MRAIRIIRSQTTMPIELAKFEQGSDAACIAARKILDATKSLKDLESLAAIENSLSAVDDALHLATDPISIHADIDISRILELLED